MIHGFILHQRAVCWELPLGLGLFPLTLVSQSWNSDVPQTGHSSPLAD